MKKFLTALFIGLTLVSFTLDASAVRLGGGASFGRSMSVPKLSTPSSSVRSPASSVRKPNPATAATANRSNLGRNLLIGAASALGFMALAHMLGLGEGFAQMLMVVLLLGLALLAFKMFTAKRQEQSQKTPASVYREGSSATQGYEKANSKTASSFGESFDARPGSAMDQFFSNSSPEGSSFEVPSEFDKEGFLNMSTAYFKMLQKAWDSGDMDSLDNYCTPEMFTELTHQRREIKGANLTEIVNIHATLAGFETTSSEYVASVKFQGKLKENGEPVDIEEIWNLVKPIDGKQGWLLAGIQQAS